MKHRKRTRQFGRDKNQRSALLKTLAGSLVRDEKIQTTEAKAKELRSFIEKLVTKARKGDLASRKLLIARLGSVDTAKKLMDDIAPKYKDRKGGYTRVVKLPARKDDAARMAIIEFV